MDVEIAQSIEDNLAPWPDAWKDPQVSDYFRPGMYQHVLPRYKETLWQYAVRMKLLLLASLTE